MEYDCKFLFVNDGSKDKTLDLLRKYAAKNTHIKYFLFSIIFGKSQLCMCFLQCMGRVHSCNGCRFAVDLSFIKLLICYPIQALLMYSEILVC